MHSQMTLGGLVAAVTLSWLVAACGSSDARKASPGTDAGTDTGSGGTIADSGSRGSGGKGGGGGASGTATGGTPASGGTDASSRPDATAEAGVEASAPEAAPPPLVCPGGRRVDGGDAGGDEWADYAAGVCKQCPGAALVCNDLLAVPGASFDPATWVLTVHVQPGLAEVVSADFSYSYYYTLPDGGAPVGVGLTPAAVDQNTLTVDLSGLPKGLTAVDHGYFTVTDGCGRTNVTNPTTDEIHVVLTPVVDGGTTAVTDCHVTD